MSAMCIYVPDEFLQRSTLTSLAAIICGIGAICG